MQVWFADSAVFQNTKLFSGQPAGAGELERLRSLPFEAMLCAEPNLLCGDSHHHGIGAQLFSPDASRKPRLYRSQLCRVVLHIDSLLREDLLLHFASECLLISFFFMQITHELLGFM